MRKLLALILLATPCFASGPKYVGTQTDAQVSQEFQNVYQDIKSPTIDIGTASTMTITQLNVSTITAITVNTASINGTFIGMGRNRIINGDMVIDQVDEGALYTVSTAGTTRNLDGYRASGAVADGVFTVQQVGTTPPTGFTKYQHIVVTTADASIGATQRYYQLALIEGYSIRDFLMGTANAKTFTYSFWIRSSLTGTFSGSIMNATVDRSYPFSYTINAANTWEQKALTITGDLTGTWEQTTSVGMYIFFDLGSGSTQRSTANSWQAGEFEGVTGNVSLIGTNAATLDIAGVQLELGSIASAFEYRPFEIELGLCQRYYEKTFDPGTAVAQNAGTFTGAIAYRVSVAGTAGANGAYWTFSTPKRSIPTVTYYNPGATNALWRNASDGADSGTPAASNFGFRGGYTNNPQVAGDGVVEAVRIHATADSRP